MKRSRYVPTARRCAARLLAAVCFSAVAAFMSGGVLAQPYPSKTVRVIVPSAPGGTTDVIARLLVDKVQQGLGQSVVVENKPGAAQAVGAALVAKAQPDGYTLLLVNSTSHVIGPVLIKDLPFDPIKDFRTISILAASPLAIVSGMQQPFTTMREFLTYAKARPEGLVIGNSESTTMLMIELLKQRTGVDFVQTSYKGGAALLPDVLGGHVPAGVLGTATAAPLHRDKKLRMLAVTTDARSVTLPDVPTVAESGVPGFDMTVRFAVMAPAEVPDAIINRLHREFFNAFNDASVKQRMAELGLDILRTSPNDGAAAMFAESEMWKSVANKAGIKPE